MLAILAVVSVLCLVGALIVLKVAHIAIKRLGLDPWTVLEWLGLAEELSPDHAHPHPLRVVPDREFGDRYAQAGA